ncbi:MAG: aspartate kinase [Candidatus Altiarchaeales archaeon]|nr:aspartate kinase [Candidatus Altiarchaeales archaeon]MBD3416584.1 aspartate kinase [Candidatus Altiarchaeales archaeon]
MVVVMKFGGSSVADGKRIQAAAKLVKAEKGPKVVVVSAMGGVTDKLIKIATSVIDLPNTVVEREVSRFCRELTMQQRKAVIGAVTNKKERGEVLSQSLELIEKLRVALLGVGYLEDLSPKSLDYIQSFGERLNVLVMSGALNSISVKSASLTGFEAGIVTDSSFGRAHPLHSKSRKQVNSILGSHVKNKITPVVTGFIAADEKARITTLGRGGSDYTASLLGNYLKAKEVQIWTDVDGILTTDPKLVSEAKLIPTLSYVEAMDLAYFGAKVIHSKMIEPAMTGRIPVRVKNTFNPSCEGTLIVSRQKKVSGVIKAVAVIKNVVIVNLEGVGMAETPNIAGRVFSCLGEANINILMISGSSESNLSFVISESDVERALDALGMVFTNNFLKSISVLEEVNVLTVVGAGMRGTKGIASKVFATVAEADVNVMMIAQGSSEVNISFVIESDDVEKAVKSLHGEFIG